MDQIFPKGLTRRACLALPLVGLAPRGGQAADYPARPVTLIVPYAAGGTADILARIVAEAFSTALGQSFIVENKAGASGTIGSNAVAKATDDGYTLLFSAGGPLTIGPNLSKGTPYRTATDFTPIGLLSQVPSFLVVNPNNPAKSVAELVAAGKTQSRKLHFASPGVGTSVHLLAELFRLEAGFEAVHVPYRGGAPAVNDLLGGHIDFLFENVPQLMAQVTAKSLRALAVTAPARIASAPDVPTLDEAGVGNVGVGTWYGLLGPRGLAPAVTTPLARALQKAVTEPAVARRLADLGADIDVRSGDAFARFIAEDSARWKATIERARIEPAN
ncbi:Bug family tripartite tricarboxylate transporter substrate binding protein [Phreatobacter stygius]|uniref:Bug family tripartite tricarboxylate transporter substrate binding protein n=1 Tax=Phreatobacter stygius TaxID=1940610 RepID=UPI001477297F|nr:tripartite tricarboxylate transporter substrate binding protein [Phreatobacter stygius]